MFDSEQSPQRKPARCSRTSSSTSASSSRSVSCHAARVGEQVPVRRGELEEPGDQRGLEPRPVGDHAEHLDGRDAELLQPPQQPVLAAGQPLVDLLDREHLAGLDHEPDHVPGDPALPDLHQPVVGPLGQRLVPRQAQQPGGGLGRRREDEVHAGQCAGMLRRVPPGRGPLGRARDRLALPDRHRHQDRTGVPVGREQQPDRPPAQLVVRQRDAGQLRPEPAGEVGVVERDDRELVRDPQPGLARGLVRAERDPVVEADQRPRSRLVRERVPDRVVRRLRPPGALQHAGERGPGRGQRLLDPGQPLAGRVPARRGLAEHDDPVPVPALEQHPGRVPAGRALVRQHRRQPAVPGQAVEQHHRVAGQRRRRGDQPGRGRRVGEAVDLAAQQVLGQPGLQLGVAAGLGDEQQVPLVQRRGQRAAHHRPAVRPGGDRVGDQRDRAGDLGPQAAGGQVGPVPQVGRGPPDPQPGRRRRSACPRGRRARRRPSSVTHRPAARRRAGSLGGVGRAALPRVSPRTPPEVTTGHRFRPRMATCCCLRRHDGTHGRRDRRACGHRGPR